MQAWKAWACRSQARLVATQMDAGQLKRINEASPRSTEHHNPRVDGC